MSVKQIPNLTSATSLNGTEQLEAVQSGASVKVTTAQIATYVQATYTPSTVTSVTANSPLTSSTVAGAVTISLPSQSITNAYLATMANGRIKGNLSGSTSTPSDVTPSSILDTFGTTTGSLLYRGASSWAAITAGTNGQILTSNGTTSVPSWQTLVVPSGSITPTGVVAGTYGSASSVGQFTVLASGQISSASSITISIPYSQVTGLGSMATQNANSVAITGGDIENTTIGASTPATGTFSNLTATSSILGTVTSGIWNGTTIAVANGGTGATTLTGYVKGTGTAALTASSTIPSSDISGLGTMATQNASAVAITGGTINGTTIGGTTPSPATFTNLTATGTVSIGTISSGTWQGTPIAILYGGTGATTASGARSNLSAAQSGANSDITSLSGLTTPLSSPQGGTGFGSYTTGDILYADSSSTLARLNDIATGNALLSGGVGVAPSWGKIGLTTHVSGTLPVSSGGTGATTLTGFLKGNGTSTFTAQATIGNSDLTNSSVTIGSTSISLGGTATTISGLTTLTLTQDPTAALQASTKQYVDGQVSAVSNTTFHTACYASTTGNLNATYSNGTGGVGATLTNAGAFAAFTADGTSPTATSRILVNNQTNAAENGIYTVTTVGDAISIPWVLTRASDYDTVGTGPNYIQTGSATYVANGNLYGASSWVMTTIGTITVGSTSLVWTQTSSAASVTVTAPLAKTGSVISLNTVGVSFGGTGLTTLTQYGVMLGNGTGNVAFASPGTTGYPLLSNGASANPSFGQLSLTAGVTGTLPVANGGTGTSTAFTAGSVIFAGASGVYSQSNTKLFWDNTNNRLGINSASPNANMTIVSNTQTAAPPSAASLPAGTDLYIMGADAANTRITQDAYGTGNYAAYTGRQARGTAAAPTASQTDDILVEVTGRGYGATGFSSASVVRIDMEAAENFTDTAQGTYISLHTTALGATSAVERFRVGPSGQWGIGGATYGTSGYALVSGGASAAPSWSQISLTAGVTGTLPVANGGTNITSYAVGDLIYASGATTLSKLAAVATGNVLRSGGITTAPAWGQVVLTTDVTGTLPVGNGGTGATTLTGYVKGNGTSAFTASSTIPSSDITGLGTMSTQNANAVAITGGTITGVTINNSVIGGTTAAAGTFTTVNATTYASGAWNGSTIGVAYGGTGLTATPTSGQIDIGNGTGFTRTTLTQGTGITITNGAGSITIDNAGVTTFSAGTTGLTPSSATTGAITLAGTLAVANGGTGQTSYTDGQLLIGNTATGSLSKATLTAGTAISVTNGNGSISIANTGVTSAVAGTGISVSGATGAVTITNSGVTSFSAGTTGLTPSTGTTGAVTLAGTLAIANGGTGLTTTPANGALDIGNGTGFTRTTLTQGTGMTITNGAGSITIANAGVTSAVAGTGVTVSAATGAVTFSIGQAVATTSNVQFGSIGVGTAASGTSGEIRATNAVTAYYSDDRLKTRKGNIKNALAKVEALNGFHYEANEVAQALGYEAKPEVGISAQEVQAVMPEVVVPAPIDEKYLTVHYERLVVLLIEAIKELSAKVKELESR